MARVFIYGSCVTRDAVDVGWDARGFELAGYVARQSLLSADQPVDERRFKLDVISSDFQRRMALGDLRGDLMRRIRAAQPLDLILWDLTDERSGVRTSPGGGMVSGVVPYLKTKAFVGPGSLGTTLDFGSPAHLERWRAAAQHFRLELSELGLENSVIVNATPWATRDDTGRTVESSGGFRPPVFNSILHRYWAIAETIGFKLARPRPADVIARADHKWGPAPFHYIDQTYLSALDSIQELSPSAGNSSPHFSG